MSSVNGIVQPQAAILLTDGAHTARDGRLMAVGIKVAIFDELRLAVAWNGRGVVHFIEEGLAGARTQREALDALPAVLRDMVARNRRELPEGATEDEIGVRLLAALWSDEADEPRLWAVEPDQVRLGPGYRPYSLVRMRAMLDTPTDRLPDIFGRAVDPADPESFDPARDGLTLLEAQRRDPWGFPGEDARYCAGGFAHITTVARDGISERVLRTWPDRIGAMIDPFAERPRRGPGGLWSRLRGKAAAA
ncbi:MAG: hypothetical protein GC201_16330 [Alphaproteobacteria bacterium]|nr:hypothetical protein [Alphaproteobacteria bacterium]